MDSFIVRIYRKERNSPYKLVGIVEEVGVSGKKGFTDFDELWEILKTGPHGGDNAAHRIKKETYIKQRRELS